MPITHAKVSGKADGGDATLVLPSDWNASHVDSAGASFPGSPATNERFFRTDRGLEYFYDGTRWLTTTLYRMEIAYQDSIAPTTLGQSGGVAAYAPLWQGTYDVYVVDLRFATTVLTTNNGSHFWTVVVARGPSGTALGSFTTAADTANVNAPHIVSVNALTGVVDRFVSITPTATGSPGSIYAMGSLTYRLVG